ncbi:hypothetical protein [Methanogenium organophilum]|uniref:Uncharacterized protein n=1 Tax=Methanogenium organophilum TaxID=2199 RepID=A0A9X9S2N6_METOG|nr:hypothetical protein [Methanogenium organophilum]WAI00403.1 hypothetical protein OU421_08160 [Methanogenium organophilum]
MERDCETVTWKQRLMELAYYLTGKKQSESFMKPECQVDKG